VTEEEGIIDVASDDDEILKQDLEDIIQEQMFTFDKYEAVSLPLSEHHLKALDFY